MGAEEVEQAPPNGKLREPSYQATALIQIGALNRGGEVAVWSGVAAAGGINQYSRTVT